MAYKASSMAARMLAKFQRRGKAQSLIRPGYVPPSQRILDLIALLALVAAPALGLLYGPLYLGLALAGAAIVWLLREFFAQDDHALVRIYGPLGRLRYLFEEQFRDKYLQYFNETNTDGRPIPRIVRNYIYQRAHDVKSLASFGTELDMHDLGQPGCRILHKNFPGQRPKPGYGFYIGEKREGVRPFFVRNTLNISAMSFGSINYRSAEALSLGARDIAYLNSGEGGLGPHGIAKGDIVFQIGTGKFGVGRPATLQDGTPTRALDHDLLKQLVQENPNVGMLQLKISQGAKPTMGGHLPGGKVTPEIAAVRKVRAWESVISPSQHAELIAATPKESILKLFDFIDELRKLTELPVGIKLCVGDPRELDLLVQGMAATGRGPDAIQIDGADGGTGAGHNIFLNYVGYGGCVEGVAYLDRALKRAGIRDNVAISASGKMFTPAHAALAFAFGADTVDSARGPMLALGCIQSLKCHTNHCPTGIATNNPWRTHGLNVPEKSTRIHHYLTGFHSDMLLLTQAVGKSDPRDIQPDDLRFYLENNLYGQYFDGPADGPALPSGAVW